jgi:hypothetical protein
MVTNKEKMPHNGGLLEKYVNESGKSRSEISLKMGYSRSLLSQLYDTPSIRMHIWWGLGLVINRNIFGELAERFPVEYKSKRERELEAELEDVQKELQIYKRIMDRK